MTLTPPSIPPVVVPATILDYRPVTDITPFTHRAGITYQQLLESLRAWTTETFYDYVHDNLEAFEGAWEENTTALIQIFNTALSNQSAHIDASLATTLAQIVAGANVTLNDQMIAAAVQAVNSATRTYFDARYVRKGTFPVTPEQFGAVGDGVANDTVAFQAALDSGKPVWAFNQYATTGVNNHLNVPIRGTGWNSKLSALPNTDKLYQCIQAAGQVIEDFCFQGNGNANVCVDTSWTIPTNGAAPSLNNRFSFVRVNGYKVTGWQAKSNNDSPFNHVVIEAVANATAALDLQAYGGMVELNNCKILGPFFLGSQQATIVGGFFFGVEICGSDYNLLNVTGGYWYPNNHGCTVWVRSGAVVQSPAVFTGTHLECAIDSGSFLGGAGQIQGYWQLNGCHFVKVGNVNVQFLQPGTSLGAPNLVNAGIVIRGGLNEGWGIDPAANPSINIVTDDTLYFGNIRGPGRRTTTIGIGGNKVLTQLPRSGTIKVTFNSGAAPAALFWYTRTTDNTQAGTVRRIDGGTDTLPYTLTIPANSAGDPNATDAVLQNNVGSAVTFELDIRG